MPTRSENLMCWPWLRKKVPCRFWTRGTFVKRIVYFGGISSFMILVFLISGNPHTVKIDYEQSSCVSLAFIVSCTRSRAFRQVETFCCQHNASRGGVSKNGRCQCQLRRFCYCLVVSCKKWILTWDDNPIISIKFISHIFKCWAWKRQYGDKKSTSLQSLSVAASWFESATFLRQSFQDALQVTAGVMMLEKGNEGLFQPTYLIPALCTDFFWIQSVSHYFPFLVCHC